MARIAVIGAGMGAMAAAARLAVAGHEVAVYERSDTYGGGVRRFGRDGFGFDTGPGFLRLPAVYRDLFVKTGKEPLERCVELRRLDPAVRHVLPGGTAVTLPASRAGTVAALDAALGGGTGERWARLTDHGRTVWEATRRPLLEEPLTADRQPLHEDPYPAVAERRGMLRRRRPVRPVRLAGIAARELHDPRLGALLESHALAFGYDPRQAPASAAVLPYLEQTFGCWYAAGGMRALATALYERCRQRKVAFTFGAPVAGVMRREGRAAGVALADGSVADADAVVAGVAPGGLLRELKGDPGDDGPHRAVMPGRVVVCLALSGGRGADAVHRTVVHTPDRDAELAWIFDGAAQPATPTVTVLRPDDAAQRPDAGHEAVTLTATVPADATWDDPAAGAAFADRMAAAVGAVLPGLAGRERWRVVRTPADTRTETGADHGAVPGPALAGAEGTYLVRGNTTRLPRLYAVGGWSHPGGGLAHAGMSGALVAGLITEGPGFRGSR